MKPSWLKAKIPAGPNYVAVKKLFSELKLHTVCEEARCPNIGDCWNRQTATIMIMGDTCTRSCGFCAVTTGKPLSLDPHEPDHVAIALAQLKLRHVVITSVDRDDLPDGGAAHFASTIEKVKKSCPATTLEVLIPDFRGKEQDLELIFKASPHILNHNVETVRRLQKTVRPQASYDCSLKVLKLAAANGMVAKSGIMIGLGETWDEILQTIDDLKNQANIGVLTIGQYLQPTPEHLPVIKYYHPDEFEKLKNYAFNRGIPEVASGPLVRSSYHADESADRVLTAHA